MFDTVINPGMRAAGFMAAHLAKATARMAQPTLEAQRPAAAGTDDFASARRQPAAVPVLVSAVIKARNEAEQIGQCIQSLGELADEIIVIDDRSDDDTALIAQAAGARVVPIKSRDGMVDELDRLGFQAARGRWILRLDADERMTPALAAKLTEVTREAHYSGVRFARKNMMFGRWARYGGWFKADQLRFFRADSWDRTWNCAPHTQPQINGQILTLPATEDLATIHFDYDSVAQFIQRSIRGYALTEAQVALAQGRRFSAIRLVLKPLKVFIGRYLLRQGFRDGARGLILAGLLAAYHLAIEANLWDLQRREAQ